MGAPLLLDAEYVNLQRRVAELHDVPVCGCVKRNAPGITGPGDDVVPATSAEAEVDRGRVEENPIRRLTPTAESRIGDRAAARAGIERDLEVLDVLAIGLDALHDAPHETHPSTSPSVAPPRPRVL